MSRPAKSPELHELAGTVSEVKAQSTSPLKPGRAKFPKHLSPAAKAEFRRLNKILLDRGHATPGDYVLLGTLAEVYARWVAEKNDLLPPPVGRGMWISTTVLDKKGDAHVKEVINPNRKHVAEDERQILSLSRALGLSPIDRDRARLVGSQKAPVIPGSAADLHPELFEVE